MENEVKNSFRSGHSKGLGFGVILMLIGVVFLGFNFGFIPRTLEHVIISWPMLLIVIGVSHYFRRRVFSGTIWILIGSFFIIPRFIDSFPTYFPGFNGDFTHVYWPLLLIAAGILIITGKIFGSKWGFDEWNHEHRHHRHRHYRHNQSPFNQKTWTTNTDGFSRNSVFGSGEHIVLDPEFKGGDLNAVFGGISLDLRRTNLPVGDTVLEVNAVFGGITIYVPTDWFIETHLDAVFGGFQDNRMPKEPLDTTKKLIITGSCVFGGGELRN
jgi:predicted membrane protein